MKRTAYVADITGQAILHVLYEQLMKYHEVDRPLRGVVRHLDSCSTTTGHCVGAIARDIRNGRIETFTAKNVILASGGAGQCFKPTTNALICTGDGIAQAYRDRRAADGHGDDPVPPDDARRERASSSPRAPAARARTCCNADGERFMEKYAPNKMELASRDVVSRAEQTEINEGRGVGPDGTGICLDITVVPKKRTLEALREIVNIGRTSPASTSPASRS